MGFEKLGSMQLAFKIELTRILIRMHLTAKPGRNCILGNEILAQVTSQPWSGTNALAMGSTPQLIT